MIMIMIVMMMRRRERRIIVIIVIILSSSRAPELAVGIAVTELFQNCAMADSLQGQFR